MFLDKLGDKTDFHMSFNIDALFLGQQEIGIFHMKLSYHTLNRDDIIGKARVSREQYKFLKECISEGKDIIIKSISRIKSQPELFFFVESIDHFTSVEGATLGPEVVFHFTHIKGMLGDIKNIKTNETTISGWMVLDGTPYNTDNLPSVSWMEIMGSLYLCENPTWFKLKEWQCALGNYTERSKIFSSGIRASATKSYPMIFFRKVLTIENKDDLKKILIEQQKELVSIVEDIELVSSFLSRRRVKNNSLHMQIHEGHVDIHGKGLSEKIPPFQMFWIKKGARIDPAVNHPALINQSRFMNCLINSVQWLKSSETQNLDIGPRRGIHFLVESWLSNQNETRFSNLFLSLESLKHQFATQEELEFWPPKNHHDKVRKVVRRAVRDKLKSINSSIDDEDNKVPEMPNGKDSEILRHSLNFILKSMIKKHDVPYADLFSDFDDIDSNVNFKFSDLKKMRDNLFHQGDFLSQINSDDQSFQESVFRLVCLLERLILNWISSTDIQSTSAKVPYFQNNYSNLAKSNSSTFGSVLGWDTPGDETGVATIVYKSDY